jgi:hypothetical protein
MNQDEVRPLSLHQLHMLTEKPEEVFQSADMLLAVVNLQYPEAQKITEQQRLYSEGCSCLFKRLESSIEQILTPQACNVLLRSLFSEEQTSKRYEDILRFVIFIVGWFAHQQKLMKFYWSALASLEHVEPWEDNWYSTNLNSLIDAMGELEQKTRLPFSFIPMWDKPVPPDNFKLFGCYMKLVALDKGESTLVNGPEQSKRIHDMKLKVVEKCPAIIARTRAMWQDIVENPKCDVYLGGKDRFRIKGDFGDIYGVDRYFLREYQDGVVPFPDVAVVTIRPWIHGVRRVMNYISPDSVDMLEDSTEEARHQFAHIILEFLLSTMMYHRIVCGDAKELVEDDESNESRPRITSSPKGPVKTTTVRPHFMTLALGRMARQPMIEAAIRHFGKQPPEGKTFVPQYSYERPVVAGESRPVMHSVKKRNVLDPVEILESL